MGTLAKGLAGSLAKGLSRNLGQAAEGGVSYPESPPEGAVVWYKPITAGGMLTTGDVEIELDDLTSPPVTKMVNFGTVGSSADAYVTTNPGTTQPYYDFNNQGVFCTSHSPMPTTTTNRHFRCGTWAPSESPTYWNNGVLAGYGGNRSYAMLTWSTDVRKTDGLGSNPQAFLGVTRSGGTGYAVNGFWGTPGYAYCDENGAFDESYPQVVTDGELYTRYSANDWTVRFAVMALTPGTWGSLTHFSILSGVDYPNNFEGLFREFLFYERVLSVEERFQLAQYMEGKKKIA